MEQERIRFTISVEPEVHAAFAELADAAGQSLSRAVGDWLRDTSSSSLFVAKKIRQLRLSPEAAMNELLAHQGRSKEALEADTAETRRLLHDIAGGNLGAARGASATQERTARGALHPPSSNTGGKGKNAKGPKR